MDDSSTPGRTYRMVLRGELSDQFATLFPGMQLERIAGNTVLTGRVLDQARLHGLIDRTSDIGVELVSIEEVGEADANGEDLLG